VNLFDRDSFEAFVLGLPAAEIVRQWGDASVGKVGGKIFAIFGEGRDGPSISFKCSEMSFQLLQEIEGIVPAPYLARAKWVALGPEAALGGDDLASYLAEAHRLIAMKLPKRLRDNPVLSVYLTTR
jgi:predicted DNA-binding protein (MmcQ/YjbR family)